MTDFRKLYDKITEDIIVKEQISDKKLKKGKYVSKGYSTIDPYGLQPTPGDLYKSPFEIRIILDENGNEIKEELVEL